MAAAQQKRRGQCRTEPGRHFGTVSPKEELRHQAAVEGSLSSRPPPSLPVPPPPFQTEESEEDRPSKTEDPEKAEFPKGPNDL